MDELAGTENRIALARTYYNDNKQCDFIVVVVMEVCNSWTYLYENMICYSELYYIHTINLYFRVVNH
jgi:hypothetical protein